MKVMKKILTMLFVMMMVLGMGTAISAEEGTSAADKGSITIDNAIVGQTYSIYKIFDLESFYDDTTNPTATKRYAYKVASEWSGFFTGSGEGLNYVDINDGYVTWKAAKNSETDVAEFAKKALAYAKDTTNSITATKTENASATTVEFTGLDLGYYLVDSTVGTLCNLTTTNKSVNISDKNEAPKVEKTVQNKNKIGTTNEYDSSNSETLDGTVNFKTTFIVKAGAENYVLHDKMDDQLEFDSSSVVVKKGTDTLTKGTDYNLVTTTTGETTPCTFHIEFINYSKDDEITVTYSAKLKKTATVGTGYNNSTWLGYGDKNGVSNTSTTTTKTYSIPVFKFHDVSGTETGLANVTFTLSVKGSTEPLKFVNNTIAGATEQTYRVAAADDATTNPVTTIDSGKFTLNGLGAGTYILEETSAPKGFNKLKDKIEITIDDDGKISYKYANSTGTATSLTAGDPIKIENKTGTILPSTGGMGTTMMYIVGAVLLIGSGVILITKKNVK